MSENPSFASTSGATQQAWRIFLSYGHDEHAAFAARLKEDLESKGHAVWFDVERLRAGADWEAHIERGLDWVAGEPGRGRVVLLMTPHSVRRPDGFCLNEVARAVALRLPIVPVMVVWCEPPLSICRIQWLDMRDCVPLAERSARYDAKLDQLAAALAEERPRVEGEQARLSSVLDPLPFDAEIAQHLVRFTGREWVIAEFDRWLAEPSSSRVFWILGNPGVGKTAIAAWLCHRRPEVAAFHLCRFGHAQKADPRRAVRSIACQLASQLPDLSARLARLDLEGLIAESDAHSLFDALIVQPLTGGADPGHPVVVLIDALDEATQGGRNELASFLAEEMDRTPPWLRLVITSRPEPEVRHPLQGLTPWVLDAGREENRQDLLAFLRRELTPFAPGGELSPATLEMLLERSEGVFLYAEWVRQEVGAGRLSLAAPEAFPRGLGGVYAAFFARRFVDVSTYEREVAPALEVLAAAREPVGLDLLAAIFDWRERERVRFARAIGSLFPETDGRLLPFHRSVVDWLTDAERSGPYFVSEADGHARLAERGWREYEQGAATLSAYALTHLPHHLTRCGRWDELEKLLTDLAFVEARCRAGTVFELVLDYEHALAQWPGATAGGPSATHAMIESLCSASATLQILRRQMEPGVAVAGSSATIVAPAGAESNLLSLGDEEGAAMVAEIAAAAGGDEDAEDAESRGSSRVAAFARFVTASSHALSSFPNDVVPLARNHADAGSVVAAADEMAARLARPWIESTTRPGPSPARPAALRTLLGHDGAVRAVALDEARRLAISAGEDGTVRLWDLASGRCRRALSARASLTALATTRDRRVIVAGDDEGGMRAWDPEGAELLWEARIHQDAVAAIAVCGDGQMALAAGWDGLLRLVETRTGRVAGVLRGHGEKVTAVAVSADGAVAVSAGSDGAVLVWDVGSRRCLRTLEGHSFWVAGLDILPDATLTAAGSWDGTLRIWDLASGRCLRVLADEEGWINAVALAAQGRIAAVAGADGAVRLWDLGTGGTLRLLEGHVGHINSLALSATGRTALTAGNDATVRLWDLKGRVAARQIERHGGKVRGVALTGDGTYAISAAADATVGVWETRSGSRRARFEGHNKYVFGIALGADHRSALEASWPTEAEFSLPAAQRTTLRALDLESGRPVAALRGHHSSVNAVAVTPDGRNALSGSWDRTVRLWNLESGRCLSVLWQALPRERYTGYLRDARTRRQRAFEEPSESISGIALTPDGRLAVAETQDRRIAVLELATGVCRASFGGRTSPRRAESPSAAPSSIAVAPDGRTALSMSWKRELHLWQVEDPSRNWVLPAARARIDAVVIAPDGRKALSAATDREIEVWELGTRRSLGTLEGHGADVNSVALHPSGQWVISASDDGTVRLWRLATFECAAVQHLGGRVLALSQIRPDGAFACGTADGRVHLLTLRRIDDAPAYVTATRLQRLLPTAAPPVALGSGFEQVSDTLDLDGLLQRTDPNLGARSEPTPIPSQFDATLTALCTACGRRFAVPRTIVEAIEAISRNAGLGTGDLPSLVLPNESWEDRALDAACPNCSASLRFNPYLVDTARSS